MNLPKESTLSNCAGRWVYILFAICLFWPETGWTDIDENTGFIGFQLLEEPISPQKTGLGAAGTALKGCGFAYYNPALGALAEKPYLTIEYGPYPAGDLHRANFETLWPIKNWFVGASIHTMSISDIILADEQGIKPGVPGSSQFTHVAIDAGYRVVPQLGFALCLNGFQERIVYYTAYGLSVSAGATYSLMDEKLTLGLSAFHLGTSTSFLDTALDWGEGARLPKSGRFGVVWSDTLKNMGYTGVLDIVFRNADNRIMVPVGFEFRPIEQIALRVGKRFNHDTEIINFGCGFSLSPLSFDLSFIVSKLIADAELKPNFSLMYTMQ